MTIPYIRFKISIMKIVYFILVVFNCYSIFGQQQNKYDHELNESEKELEYKKITPTYRIQVEGDTVRFEDFLITISKNDKPLEIRIKNDTVFVDDMFTQNIVCGDKNQLDYSNAVSLIHYYSYYNILMFQAHFFPCSGLVGEGIFKYFIKKKQKKQLLFEDLEKVLKWKC